MSQMLSTKADCALQELLPYIELISQPYIQPSFASTNAKVRDLHDSFVVTT